MEISHDVYSLSLLQDGMYVSEIVRDSSFTFIDKLKQNNLVQIDNTGKLYLTDKGQLAKKMGLKKYMELEKLEQEISGKDPQRINYRNQLLFNLMCGLHLVVTVVLVYIIFYF